MRIINTIIIILLFVGLVSSQSLDSIGMKSRMTAAKELHDSFKPKEALAVLQPLLLKAQNLFDPNDKLIGVIYYQIASAKLDLADYKEAKSLLDDALEIFELYDSVSVELGNAYMLIGIYYDYMTDYDKALAYYDLTKKMYLKLFPRNDYRFSYLYNNMGICIYYQGDIERALNFFNKSLAITMESVGLFDEVLAKELNNLSLCYSSSGKVVLAKESLDISWNIANHNKILETPQGANIYHSLAILYYELGDFDRVLEYLDLAYQIRIKNLSTNHPEVASNYFMIANTYREKGEFKKAKTYFKKALNIYIHIFGEQHPETAMIHTSLSELLLAEKNFKKALLHINNALSTLEYDENIPLRDSETFNISILKALDIKAQIHYNLWKNKKNVLQLKKADRTYTDLIQILNKFRKGFKEEVSKEVIASDFFHVFDHAIETSYALYKESQNDQFLKDAFQRCEYSSNFVLLEGRRNSKAKHLSGIPDSLIQIEQQLKLDITLLEKIKKEEQKKELRDPSKIINVENQIFDLKEKHYKLVQKFETDYPKYYRLKYDMSTVEIEKLQSQILDDDQVFVEYFVGEKNIFVFIISKELFKVEKIEKTFPLEFWVEDLRKKITEFQYPFNLDSDYHTKLVTYCEGLYWELFYPFEDSFKERIIIAPGGVLAEIPFECLIKQTGSKVTSYKDHEYLIQDYAISYCYSATLLDEMVSNRKIEYNHNSIAFAPNFNKFGQSSNLRDLLLLPLEFNTPEVEDIAKIMNAKAVVGKEATEDYFIEHSQKYSILHFATHAKADKDDSDFSFLAFSEVEDSLENELLYVKDLYNIPLQSEMVTLSACETGVGENRKGEGVISIARGFSYSGTSNVNTSLWNVNDAKTAKIMKFFYENIAEGMPKDQALRMAKKEFISSYSNNMQVHPFFWTAMISIGDMHPISLPPRNNLLLLIFAIIGVLCLGWWFRYNRPSKMD